MRPTFTGFEVARRGLLASQAALDIVGQNVSNANTPGYTRQRVDLVAVSYSGMRTKTERHNSFVPGQGVMISGVSQFRDPLLDKRFREEMSEVQYYNTLATSFEEIEGALDEIDSSNIKDGINEILKALHSATSPGSTNVATNSILNSTKSLISTLNSFDKSLNDLQTSLTNDAKSAVKEVNAILSQLAATNQKIHETAGIGQERGTVPNDLLDQRNLLLDQLSSYTDVKTTVQNDNTITVEIAGEKVVDGTKAQNISLQENDNGTISYLWGGSGEIVRFASGSLKAAQEVLNGNGNKATQGDETFNKGIPYFRDQINELSKAFANIMNSTVPDVDANGIVIGFKELVTSNNKAIDAGSIRVSEEWSKDPDYFLSQAVNQDGSKDKNYLLTMIKKFESPVEIGDFKGTLNEFVDQYTSVIGQEKSFYEARLDASAAVASSVEDQRDSYSGVNLDEEGAMMMSYQRTYQACARLMTVLDEALDTIINGTGLIGR